jgi:high affinity cAMP-specific and IBMX-insensitive 3',5'-cyclic phosphodiesterase 8
LSQTYVKNLSPEINKILDTEESWGFDIIALERLTNNRPLVTLGLKIMNRFRVCEFLKIEEVLLVNWLTLMESNYKISNPYHNSTHAADVLHATAYFLSTDKITVSIYIFNSIFQMKLNLNL